MCLRGARQARQAVDAALERFDEHLGVVVVCLLLRDLKSCARALLAGLQGASSAVACSLPLSRRCLLSLRNVASCSKALLALSRVWDRVN